MNLRAHAATTLAPIIRGEASLQSTFDSAMSKVNEKDKALFNELVNGTLRNYHRLNAILRLLVSKKLKTKDADIQALLLLGLYQLRNMRIPDHAALSETVNATRILKKNWASKLCNGVLRSYQRETEALENKLKQNDEFLYSHPQWMVDILRTAWPDQLSAICEANNTQARLTIRVNARLNTREAYLQRLQENTIDASAGAYSDDAIVLQTISSPTSLPNFEKGALSVQDEAAQLAASLLDLKEGQRVLDACCAPGGKTAHILEKQSQLKTLIGIDLEASRIERTRENLLRLNLHALLLTADAAELDTWWDGEAFDRILLDAPCSASGVIRKHPDIKLLRRASDIATLVEIQAQLLRRLWQTLAAGGKLLYATCSVFPQENAEQIAAFLNEQDDAKLLPLNTTAGLQLEHGRQLLTNIDSHDGFFYALLEKQQK